MTIITHIGELVGIVPEGVLRKQGAEMDEVGSLKDAYLTIEGERISGFGNMSECPVPGPQDEVIDAEGGMVIPAFCDSHTHICYAGTREQEFIDKINGLSYEEIAAVEAESSTPPTCSTARAKRNYIHRQWRACGR